MIARHFLNACTVGDTVAAMNLLTNDTARELCITEDSPIANGYNAIDMACENCMDDVFEYYFMHYNLRSLTDDRYYNVSYACQHKLHGAMCKILDFNELENEHTDAYTIMNSENNSALELAIYNSWDDVACRMLDLTDVLVELNDDSHDDSHGDTYLICAAEFGCYGVVRKLLTERIECMLECYDDANKSALHYLIDQKQDDLALLFLTHVDREWIAATGDKGITHFAYACEHSHTPAVALKLCEIGCSSASVTTDSNKSALVYACENKHCDMSPVIARIIEIGELAPHDLRYLCDNGRLDLVYNVIGDMRKVRDETECPVCYEHVVRRKTACGHSLCKGCYDKLTKPECPQCRAVIKFVC